MPENNVKSLGETAAEFGVSRPTISDLIRVLGITPKKMTNGKCKGLDPRDRKRIGERLKQCADPVPA